MGDAVTERDAGRARFYEAEHLVHRLFDHNGRADR